MRRIGPCFTLGVLLLLAACASPLRLTVLFDQVHGLQQGDPVVWEDNHVGRVEAVRYTTAGRFEVAAEVSEDYRAAVTDRCRFVVSEGSSQGAKVLEMLCSGEGGQPLADGAVVEGTTRLQALAQDLEAQTRGFLEGLSTVPRDWVSQLERELDRLAEELGQAGEEARRRLRRDVLPELERRLERLRQWLRERGREDEAKPLERKLERLKEV